MGFKASLGAKTLDRHPCRSRGFNHDLGLTRTSRATPSPRIDTPGATAKITDSPHLSVNAVSSSNDGLRSACPGSTTVPSRADDASPPSVATLVNHDLTPPRSPILFFLQATQTEQSRRHRVLHGIFGIRAIPKKPKRQPKMTVPRLRCRKPLTPGIRPNGRRRSFG
jgi:hypothetical protein